MNAFSTTVAFMRMLLPLSTIDEENEPRNEEYAQTIRKVHMTNATLRRYLQMEDSSDNHPLLTINKQLQVRKSVFSESANSLMVTRTGIPSLFMN